MLIAGVVVGALAAFAVFAALCAGADTRPGWEIGRYPDEQPEQRDDA
jgi:hypothetical protein